MDNKINSYKDLIVWQKSIMLALDMYTLTEGFPKQELYGLVSQMRRAAVSIPSNIAEGSKRGSRKDYRKFIRNSFGSGAELETQLILAQRLNYCTQKGLENIQALLDGVMKMLNSLIKSLEKKPQTKN